IARLGFVAVLSPTPFPVALRLGRTTMLFVGCFSGPPTLIDVALCLGWTICVPTNAPLDIDFPKFGGRKNERGAFAQRFAECLLLPPAGMGVALREIRRSLEVATDAIGDIELIYLARIFGVPFEVAARRCQEEHLIPRGGARALIEFVNDSFGGEQQRATQLGIPSGPIFQLVPLPAAALTAIS